MSLPELDKNRRVHQHKALIFDHDTRYNVTFGMDFLTKTGIDIKYSTGTIQWFDNELILSSLLILTQSSNSVSKSYTAWTGTTHHAMLWKY